MKKNFLLALFNLIVMQVIFAQNQIITNKAPAGEVVYKQISLWDDEKTAVLLFTENESMYYYGRTPDGSQLNNKVKKDDFHYQIDLGDKEGWTYYKNGSENKSLYRNNIWTKFFIIEEALPQFDWKIIADTKKIGSYNCQKATCTFRGRDYEAWFTPDIPVNAGPWKFCGLPGLIVEAYDVNREYKFILVSVAIPAKTNVPIIPPKLGQVVTYDEFKSIYTKKMKALTNSYKIKSDPNATGTLTATVNNHSIEQF